MRIPITGTALLLIVTPALPAFADAEGYGRYHHMGEGWMGGGWIAGTLMMILFFAGLAALVVLVIRALKNDQGPGSANHRQSAREILEERFARGEIDRAEFEERRSVLGG